MLWTVTRHILHHLPGSNLEGRLFSARVPNNLFCLSQVTVYHLKAQHRFVVTGAMPVKQTAKEGRDCFEGHIHLGVNSRGCQLGSHETLLFKL